ncbi:MAG TPA: Crp/Fnr family transcriptional regulator [Candidatus Sulfotelmatobacter sp.]|nr:Crp/Fnr family transcriptional regulator [Candidatus Sulfotelmatobacter sp.]
MGSASPIQKCSNCCGQERYAFCKVSDRLIERLRKISSTAAYRKKERLFVEGQEARGVFVLCTGGVKLSSSSRLGKNIITRICNPGDVIGLNAVVSGLPYTVTAETMVASQVKFLPRSLFLSLMNEDEELTLVVAEQLSISYYRVHDAVRVIGLAIHPVERLASFLLSWVSDRTDANLESGTMSASLTHQEIADAIGSTRQTVTKLFSEFRKQQLLQSEGASLAILNRTELEKIAQF